MREKLLSVILELIGIITVSSGIGIELASGAEIGYIVITVGSLLVATGGFIWAKLLKRRY
jgi:hypothetical protein